MPLYLVVEDLRASFKSVFGVAAATLLSPSASFICVVSTDTSPSTEAASGATLRAAAVFVVEFKFYYD